MDERYKICFSISYESHATIAFFANYFGVEDKVLIRYLLFEAIEKFYYDHAQFQNDYVNYREIMGKKDPYNEDIRHSCRIKMKISHFLFDGIKEINSKYPKQKKEIIIKNLILMSLNYYHNLVKEYKAEGKVVSQSLSSIEQRYSISSSDLFNNHLKQMADMIGISTNKLISLIITKYVIDHSHVLIDHMNSKTNGFIYGFW